MANISDHAQNGFEECSTDTINGDYTGFLVIGSAGATVSGTTSVGDNLSSIALAEGVYIGGPFTQIITSAGIVLGIHRKDK